MNKNKFDYFSLVMQIVNQIQETILPILLRRPSPRRVMNKICKKIHEKSQKILCCHKEVECLSPIQDDFSIKHAKFSLLRETYESTYGRSSFDYVYDKKHSTLMLQCEIVGSIFFD